MTLGVGIFVVYAIRYTDNGLTMKFQLLGALLSFLGCAAGNFLTVWHFIIAQYEEVAFGELLANLNPAAVPDIMISTFSGMDLLFYGIAVFEGFRVSLHQNSLEELDRIVNLGAAPL